MADFLTDHQDFQMNFKEAMAFFRVFPSFEFMK